MSEVISRALPIQAAATLSIAARARRRIRRRLLPFLFVVYVIAYLDRVNLGYAALEMTGDLKFSPEIYGYGAGIFFLGYFLLEIPGTILVEKWSARAWIARIMISWGIVAACAGFVHTPLQFYWVRFILGAAEAGFFPGILVYLSHWIRYEDRAKAMALFMAAQPISNLIGSPISGLLLNIHWLGLAGWRWLFILEGLPAVLFGFVTLFYLTDWPHQAKWLSPEEQECTTSELEQEREVRRASHSQSTWRALLQPPILLLALALFCVASAVYGFTLWLPTVVKRLSGFSNLRVSMVSALPYCVGLGAMLFAGWSSDKTKERRWHTAVCLMCIALGLAFSVLPGGVVLPMLCFCVAAAGMYGYLPCFWSIPTSFLTGTAAAASIGFINSVGNLGGFAGPYVFGYLNKTTHSFSVGVLFLALCGAVAAAIVLSLPPPTTHRMLGSDVEEIRS